MLVLQAETPVVFLSGGEMLLARAEAENIHGPMRAKGARDAHGMPAAAATRDMEASGHACELAVSLYLDAEWSAVTKRTPEGKPVGPDVGERTQVRSSDKPRRRHNLIVRPRDLKQYGDVPFVLVIREGNAFKVKGWAMAGEMQNLGGRWWDGGDPSRPKAWFLSENKLRPIRELENA